MLAMKRNPLLVANMYLKKNKGQFQMKRETPYLPIHLLCQKNIVFWFAI